MPEGQFPTYMMGNNVHFMVGVETTRKDAYQVPNSESAHRRCKIDIY
jgi:hypothetical protein